MNNRQRAYAPAGPPSSDPCGQYRQWPITTATADSAGLSAVRKVRRDGLSPLQAVDASAFEDGRGRGRGGTPVVAARVEPANLLAFLRGCASLRPAGLTAALRGTGLAESGRRSRQSADVAGYAFL